MRLPYFFIILLFSIQATAVDLKQVKQLYKSGQWDQFFAHTVFYRSQSQKKSDLNTKDFDHILALELLALARHCQWMPIFQLNDRHIENSMSLDKSRRAMSIIKVKKEYHKFLNDPKNQKKPLIKKLKHSRDHWSVNIEQFAKFTNPQNLRVKVISLCE